MDPLLKAEYQPRNLEDVPNQWEIAIGKEFIWYFVYEIDEIKYYVTNDINFPTSAPIKEYDLNITDTKFNNIES